MFPLLRARVSINSIVGSTIYLLLLLLLLYCATGFRISHDKALCRVHRPIKSIVQVMPSLRHSPTLNLVHLVFVTARAQLSSDIGLSLAERLWQISCFS